ncbi:MAG: hypothetical protein AAF628_19020 [Planctomycetota bacterium]
MYYRLAGNAVPASHPVLNAQPFFNHAGELASQRAPWAKVGVEIDAFSTNVNFMPVDSQGVIDQDIVSYDWAALAISVGRNTIGEPSSVFQLHHGDPTGGDLYEFVFPDSSQGFDGELVLAVDESHIRLNGSDPNITALDVYVPALLNPPGIVGGLHNVFEAVVFSVTDGSEAAARTAYNLPTLDDGAILRCDWQPGMGGAEGTWSDVYIYKTAAALGLAGRDVTAMAWHKSASEEWLLVSTDDPTIDPLQFIWGTNSRKPLEYEPDGSVRQPVSGGLKIKLAGTPDKITALSAFDPRVDMIRLLSQFDSAPPGTILESSAFRVPDTTGPDDLIASMRDTTGTVTSTWALCWGWWEFGTPILRATVPMPASGAPAAVNVGDVPAILTGFDFKVQWTTTSDLYSGLSDAWSDVRKIRL